MGKIQSNGWESGNLERIGLPAYEAAHGHDQFQHPGYFVVHIFKSAGYSTLLPVGSTPI